MWPDVSNLKLSEMTKWIAAKSDRQDPDKWLPLWMHLADTAGIMGLLVDHWLPADVVQLINESIPDDGVKQLCIFLGVSHDIGKSTALFETRILSSINQIRTKLDNYNLTILSDERGYVNNDKTPHALASAAILHRKGVHESITAVVGSHHGKPPGLDVKISSQLDRLGYCQNYYGKTGESNQNWQLIWDELYSMALSLSGYADTAQLPVIPMKIQVLLTGLIIMADWIASNTSYFPLISVETNGLLSDYPQRVSAAWEKLSLPEPWQPASFSMDEASFTDKFGFSPNAVQQMVCSAIDEADDFGLCILEAQMGIGKTEAALAAAEMLASRCAAGGLYFGLPTQATSNGIFARLMQWADNQSTDTALSIRLAHGMAMLNEDYRSLFHGTARLGEEHEAGGLIVHPWFEGRKQALLSNFVIGTIDQLLMAALKQKHVMLRHLGLAGKVVIIDECHAYDVYMSQYLDMALTWLGAYHVPVIILSATLPAQRRTKLVKAYLRTKGKAASGEWEKTRAYPLFTWTDGMNIRQKSLDMSTARLSVSLERISDEAIPELLRDKLSDGGCAGIIVNTVRRAQEIARQLRESLPEKTILLFHSGFLMPDRAEKEDDLIKRIGKKSTAEQRNNLIVIGTQVLEQSLDIDFDFLITDLCPMDLLLQRIGRLHRHQRARPQILKQARCAVLYADTEEFERGASLIYDEWLLLQTRDNLPDSLTIPDDISDLINEVYDEDIDKAKLNTAYKKKLEQFELREKNRQNNADLYCIPKPSKLSSATIQGWLDADTGGDEHRAAATVRDGVSSIEVIMLVRARDGSVHYLPWREESGEQGLSCDFLPSQAECRKIASQRIRLPALFSYNGRYLEVSEQLKQENIIFEQWQQSPWLRDELILLLDEDLTKTLCGFSLSYSAEEGLSCKKEENVNE